VANLNALIAQGAQFNLPNPVDQYSKVMQLQQMGQANQLNRLKMDEYTRGVTEQNAMRNVMSRSDFDVFKPEHQAELLRAAPSTAPGFLEKLAQVQKEKAQTGLYGAQAVKMNYEVKQQQLTQGLTEISNMSNEADALASLDANVANGSISPEKAVGFKKQITAMGFPNWQKQILTGMTDAKNRLDALAEQEYQASRGQPVAGTAPGAVNATPVGPTTSPAAGKAIKPIANGVFADSTVSPENIRLLEKLGDQATFFDPTSYWTQNSEGKLVVGRSGTPVAATPAAAAGAPAQPDIANALALKIQNLEAQQNQLEPFLKSSSAKAKYDKLGKQIDNLSKGFSVSAGGAYFQPGVGMVERPAAAPTSADVTTMKALGYPITQEGFKAFTDAKRQDRLLTPEEEAQKTRIAKAGATNLSVSTEKKYGEQFAGKMADRDDAKLGAAEKAPQLAESANRIIGLVNQGNLFTGPAADVKLNIARALNVVGASNEEKIANTESLIAATGQSTLDAIKAAGLGTGQGFTDKDLKFLQGIAGGTITYTATTLMELARLQHQTAVRSVDAWSTRLKQIPKSSIEGLGLSTEPIKVPPLLSSAIFAVNPKTGERIQSVDNGANWTPVGGK
jgi:hypothetical protein